MGLDIVELVMRIEEEFEIDIPNEDAAMFVTIGNIADYIIEHQQIPLEKQGEFWKKLRMVVADHVSVDPDKVHHGTRMVQDLQLD